MISRRFWSGLLLAALSLTALGACTRDPNVRKQKYLESGNRYFDQEKYREAAIQYLNAIQVDPRFVDAHYQLAQAYLRLGVWSGAASELLRTVDIQPEHWKAQIDIGNLMLASRQFQQAQEKADLVLSKDPGNIDAHILKANSLAALENLPASLKEMQKAIELAPDRPRSYLNLAILQAGARDPVAAEASFKKGVQLDPKSLHAALALGNFYQQQSRFDEAEKEFRRAISVEPAKPVARVALARLFVGRQQRAQAEQVLREAKAALPNDPEAYRLLGDFFFTLGEIDKAAAEFGALTKEHPDDVKSRKNYIQLLILLNKLEEAAKLNDQLLKESPKDVEGLIHKGQMLNRQNKPREAVEVFSRALKSEPENAVAQYHLGLSYSILGNLAQAEAAWREAARLRPNMPAAQQALAGVALRKGDNELLMQTAETLIAAEPSSPGGYIFRAAATLGRGGNHAAIEADLKRAIDVAPQNAVGYSRLAAWRVLQKKWADAEKLYEQSLEKDPNFGEAIQGLIIVYAQQKRIPAAIERVHTQMARVPTSSGLPFLLAQLQIQQKDFQAAAASLEKALSLNPNYMEAIAYLGQVHATLGALDRAAASYEKLIQQFPGDIRGYILVGSIEEKRGNPARAQEMYNKVLQIQPENALAANNLAFLMIEGGGNPDLALTYAQTARKGLPESPNVADTLAWVYYKRGLFGLAVDLLEEAVKKMPENPTYHYHLGLAYQKSNNKNRAKTHLEKALQLRPDYPKAAEIRKALTELGG